MKVQDAGTVELAKVGRPRYDTAILRAIRSLDVGQALVFRKEEWEPKTSPHVYIGSAFRAERTDKRFSVRLLKSRDSYAVIRLA